MKLGGGSVNSTPSTIEKVTTATNAEKLIIYDLVLETCFHANMTAVIPSMAIVGVT